MSGKEWREVGRQSLYFVLALAAMALLLAGMDLLVGMMGAAPARPLEGEKLAIILGLWLLVFSMFMGLSPFAMDVKQKGMEYLLTLPLPRRRLLWIKFLPRLAAVIFFYLAFAAFYGLAGDAAFGGGFAAFSLTYFALFFISFSFAVVHENFIIQSLWAGVALSGYLAVCLYIVSLGFSWKFKMPSAWAGNRLWYDLAYDTPSLLAAIAVFLLMAAPFTASLFLAFKKFDLKPARAFNRRQLLIFVPLMLLAFAVSLGVTYLAQSGAQDDDADFSVLKDGRVLKTGFSGELTLYGEHGRQRIDTKRPALWENVLLEEKDRLFMHGYDIRDGSRFIARLDLSSLSWKVLHRCPERFFVSDPFCTFYYDGEGFVYLRRGRAEAERPGISSASRVKTTELELVRLDRNGVVSPATTFHSPLFREYSQPRVIGRGLMNGQRFWLIAQPMQKVLRLWEGGRVDDLGVSRGMPAYCGDLLLTIGEGNSLQVRRLTAAGSETMREIPGDFMLPMSSGSMRFSGQVAEIYAKRDKQIVRIDLATLAVDDVGPWRGSVRMVPSGDFYYVEFENYPGLPSDKWKKLYRLQGGKMVLLKKFEFANDGYGHVMVSQNGAALHLLPGKKVRLFAFPDLRELRYQGMN